MYKRFLFSLFICIFMLIPSAIAVSSIPFQEDYEAIDRAAKSCFLVEIIGDDGSIIGTGSGFVAFDEHVFITNHHVIDDSISIQIHSDQYQNSHTLTELIAADEDLDIAILAFPEGTEYEALSLAPNYKVLRGQPVTAIGSPQGIINTVSSGNISSILSYSDGTHDLQFTAPVSHGSSGGALFNNEGNVIALVYAKHTEGENMNYAVPIEYVIDLYKSTENPVSVSLGKHNFRERFITPPEHVSVIINDNGKPEITWSTVEDAVDYRVYRVSPKGTEKLIGTRKVDSGKTTGTTWDASPLFGQTVSYYVVARSKVASSEKSEYVTIDIPPKPTPTPSKVPTPKPTSHPTPTPSAVPPLPDGIKDSYKPGASGSDIRLIKEQMQKLGYYSEGASLGSAYNETMEERVKLFQKDNNLEVTGILDNQTLLAIFAQDTRNEKALTPTPKPTTKKSSVSEFALVIPDDSYAKWYVSDNQLFFNLQVKNTSSSRSVVSFELNFYPIYKDSNNSMGNGKRYTTIDKTIKPGKTVYTGDISIPNADRIRKITVAIRKIKYSDGTEVVTNHSDYATWSIE